MKRFTSFLVVCVLIVGISSGMSVLAADIEQPVDTVICIEPHASDFLASYAAWTSRAANGSLRIEFAVNATRQFQTVGAMQITIQARNGNSWSNVSTHFATNTNGMRGSNTSAHGGSITHAGTSGREYRALVTVFAGNVTGDQRVITTNSTVL